MGAGGISSQTIAEMLAFTGRQGIKPTMETFEMTEADRALEHTRSGKARFRVVLIARRDRGNGILVPEARMDRLMTRAKPSSFDPMEFDGKRALVTGSTKGMGEAIVRRLAAYGEGARRGDALN